MGQHNATVHAASGPRGIDHGSRVEVRTYRTSETTPCQKVDPNRTRNGADLWFSQFKDRVMAVRGCQECPFIGRCGFNAVARREEYGVWGGLSLPGDKSGLQHLEAAYDFLLAQFEARRHIELPGLPAPAMPSASIRRRSAGDDNEADGSADAA